MAKIDIATAKQEIIDWLYEGGSILGYCQQEGRPKRRTIYDWVDADPDFGAQFARARREGAAARFDKAGEIVALATPETVHVAKLQAEHEYKAAACFCQSVFGSKVAIGGDASAPAIKVENTGPAPPQTTAEVQEWAAKLAGMVTRDASTDPTY
mgnify:CR=1 FL=1